MVVDHHHYHAYLDPSHLSALPCVERKLFIAFKEQMYLNIEMPKELRNDQFHMMTAPGSQFYCTTVGGSMLKCEYSDNNKIETTIVPTSEDFSNDKTRVKFLLAGYYHVIAIKESNKIYVHVLSDNSQYGALQKPSSSVEPFSLVATNHFINDGKTITHAVCGTYSTIVVLDNRTIYIAGRVETQVSDYTLYKIEGDPLIRHVSAGYGHMVVQTMSGDLYVMGMNNYGQTFSVTSSNILEKISIPGVLNITALRLSHMTCYTTKDTYEVNGYIGADTISGFERGISSYMQKKHMDYTHELRMYGGFTSVVYYNERTDELVAFGSASNAPAAPYNILDNMKKQHAENNAMLTYLDSHKVIDVACGSSLIAVMMDVIRKNTLLLNNLLKMKKYATKELEHSSETVPFHDVIILH